MKQTGWNRRDFLKTAIKVAGVTGVGSNINLLATAESSGRSPPRGVQFHRPAG